MYYYIINEQIILPIHLSWLQNIFIHFILATTLDFFSKYKATSLKYITSLCGHMK